MTNNEICEVHRDDDKHKEGITRDKNNLTKRKQSRMTEVKIWCI